MKTLVQLREEKRAVAKQVHDLYDATEKENRGLTPEERSKLKELAQRDSDIDADIEIAERFQVNADAQRRTDEDRSERDRLQHQGNRRSFSANDIDPHAPLTAAERSLALTTWALGGGSGVVLSEAGVAACQRAGLSLTHKTIELMFDRGIDENGIPQNPPRNYRDVQRQSDIRREYRNREQVEYRANPEQYRQLLEFRAQSVGTTTAGGFTVPDEMMLPIEVALLQWGAMRQVARILSTPTGGDLPIPTNDDTANKGEIIGENTTVNEQDLVFAQIIMQAYKYSSKMIRLSVELLQDSATNMPAFLGSALGTRIGRITNDHFTTGTGTAQPRGIVVAAGNSGVTAGTAGALTHSELLTLKHSVDPAYRANGAGFMWNDSTFRIAKSMVDLQGRPIWLPSLIPGEPPTFDGDPYTINQSMAGGAAAKGVLYGDFQKYLIREVRGITLQRLDERFAELHQVAFLAFARFDGDLLDAGTDPVKYLTTA